MKSKNDKTKTKKKTGEPRKTVQKKKEKELTKKPVKSTSKEKTAKVVKPKSKKFFPKDAKPSKPKKPAKVSSTLKPREKMVKKPKKEEPVVENKPVARRSPWMKKPIENPHSTPASSCYSMRDEFDNYIAKKYKKLKEDQIRSLWISVSNQMLSEPRSRLLELVDDHLQRK